MKLEKATFEFSQEANCNSKNEIEILTIEFESPVGLDEDKEGFYILKTEGWSIDSEEEIKKLIERINKIL
jgi:hypothetical protein